VNGLAWFGCACRIDDPHRLDGFAGLDRNHDELGDPDETIRLGEGLDTSRLPAGIRGRRSAVLIDLARGYAMRRMDAAAVNTLLEAEQVAAEAVRFNVLVHELLRELLKREHRATTPQLRPLAERVGVLS
jgi:hypothetical protein